MLFSRILVAAVTFIGAAHALSLNPPHGHKHTPRDVPSLNPPHGHKHTPRDAPAVSVGASPMTEATNKLHKLRAQVADTMAGPREGREAKFIDISGQALQITKDCNAALQSQSVLSKLTSTTAGDDMNKFSRAMFRVLRSCKGIRSTAIAANVDQIMDQMEIMQTTVQGGVSGLVATLLTKFGINLGRLSAISAALAA